MSANNWAVCPSCLKAKEDAKAAQQAAVVEAYGKVPVEEFDRLRSTANAPINFDALKTFRENYEFWINGSTIEVTYDGGCSVCGSGVKFTDSRPINLKAPPV